MRRSRSRPDIIKGSASAGVASEAVGVTALADFDKISGCIAIELDELPVSEKRGDLKEWLLGNMELWYGAVLMILGLFGRPSSGVLKVTCWL